MKIDKSELAFCVEQYDKHFTKLINRGLSETDSQRQAIALSFEDGINIGVTAYLSEVFDKKCTELDDKYRYWLEKNKLETEARHTDFLKNLQDMMIKFS